MKITVIGGGGVRSMFLAKSIAQQSEKLNITDLCFMDNNAEKLRIYGTMAKKVSNMINPSLNFTLTTDEIEAVRDADYVITTIRVGEDKMRVRDERLAISEGVIGQETTGAAGFSFAMRSIPALEHYCELIKKYSKKSVKVFNFTNPAGVVSQTLRDMGYDFTYGICDAPSGMLRTFAKLYGKTAEHISGEVYGLNHLSYFEHIYLDGRDIIPELIENEKAYTDTDMRYFEKDLIKDRKAILNEYLYYFYYSDIAFKNISKAEKTRGEQICEINENMTKELSKIDIENDFETALSIFNKWYSVRENNYMASETSIKRQTPWEFDIFSEDEGGYAGVALNYIKIVESNTKGTMILCTKNDGAIPFLKDDDIVEITCDITKNECKPHSFPNVDEQNAELIRRVKNYERLSSLAIRKKSRDIAIQALTLHPLVNSYSIAKKLVDEYIELNKEYNDGWK